MMRTILTPITLFLLSAAALAQPARFDALLRDLGEMRQQESRSTTFIVYNTGVETLHLTKPRAGCGCTAALLSRSDIEPGDSATIAVDFHSGPAMLGEVSKTILVGHMYNGVEHDLATLRIRAEVVGDLRYEPGMLQFRAVIGDTVRFKVTFRSNSSETVEITDIVPGLLAYIDSSEGNTYHVEKVTAIPFEALEIIPSTRSIPPGGEGLLDVRFMPTAKGQINGAIRVALDRSEIRIPVVGVVLRTMP